MSEKNIFEKQSPEFKQSSGIQKEELFKKQEAAEPAQEPRPDQSEQLGRQDTQENQEQMEKVEDGFAQELEKTPKRGFLKKLQRIAGAFTLAGLFLFSPQESVAPEATKEAWAVKDLRHTFEHQSELYKEILGQLTEKGGVNISPQFPETVYKPKEVSGETRLLSRQPKIPFYNKPEIILGEKFIKENPEKAKEYYEKISATIKATVTLRDGRRSQGSGTIVRGAENRLLVLTNAHICGTSEILSASFADGRQNCDLKVMAKDVDNDIAVLGIPDEVAEKLHGIEALKIGKSSGIKLHSLFSNEGETVAAVGNPLGFPYAVGIGKRPPVLLGIDFGPFIYYPDERFSRLELYSGVFQEIDIDWDKVEKLKRDEVKNKADKSFLDIFKITEAEKFFSKGDAIPGMSGGPIISLDAQEPELLGITCRYFREEGAAKNKLGIGVSADTIIEFLKKNNLI